jgi:uncharacterized repeat protein (TIGR01451 family)
MAGVVDRAIVRSDHFSPHPSFLSFIIFQRLIHKKPMSRLSLTFLCCITGFTLAAQFARIEVNEGIALAAGSPTRYAGDHDFITQVGNEIFHLVPDADTSYRLNWIESTPEKVYQYTLHDTDRDGDLDLYVYSRDGTVFYFFKKENGRYYYFPEWNLAASNTYNLISDNFDGDGYEDLMINHQIFLNTGVNERVPSFRYPVGNVYYYKATYMTDFDRDGDQDILFHLGDDARILNNNGNEFSLDLHGYEGNTNSIVWIRPIATPAGDFYLYYDGAEKNIRQLEFTADSFLIHPLLDVTLSATDVLVQDINQDGAEELLILNGTTMIIGEYDYASNTLDTLILQLPEIMSMAGISHTDMGTEMITGSPNSYYTYHFDANLHPILAHTAYVGINSSGDKFIDVDGDLFVDVASGNKVKSFTPDYSFSQVRLLDFPVAGGALADFDHDGDADYVLTHEWYPNEGNYTFGSVQSTNDPTPIPDLAGNIEIARGDLDLDGDTDILTYGGGKHLSVFYNNNNIDFEPADDIDGAFIIKNNFVAVSIVDLDKDNDLDIVMCTWAGLYTLKRNLSGGYDGPFDIYSGTYQCKSLSTADYNLDGYPDFLVSTQNSVSSTNGEVWLYTGSLPNPQEKKIFNGTGFYIAAFGDMDQSGWLDIVYHYNKGLFLATTTDGINFQSTLIDKKYFTNARLNVQDLNHDGRQDVVLYMKDNYQLYYYLNGLSGIPGGPCPPDGITCYSQEQVDRFKFKYSQCTSIPGDLRVDWKYVSGKHSTIKDLSAFSNLHQIGGNLEFRWLDSVPDLQALNNIERIGGDLFIANYTAPSFTGLSNLGYIGGDLHLFFVKPDIPSDSTLLTSLDTILGNVEIDRCEKISMEPIIQPVFYGNISIIETDLLNTYGFQLVDTIRGELKMLRTNIPTLDSLTHLKYLKSLFLYDNSALKSINILNNLVHLDSTFEVSGSPQLRVEHGFESLQTVGEDFYLEAIECNSFHQLDSIQGDAWLRITEYDSLAFTKLAYVGSDVTFLNYQEPDFNQFQLLDSIHGDLSIGGMLSGTLKGLDSLKYIQGNLFLYNNPGLRSIYNLNNNLYVGDVYSIYGNKKLAYCDEPSFCNHIAAGRPYEVTNNGFDCMDISQVRCLENRFTGVVYHDLNENLVHDPTEATLSNVKVIFPQTLDTIITSHNGYFATNAGEGDSLHIEVMVPADWSSTNDPMITVDSFVPGDAHNFGNDVGLVPNFFKQEVQLSYNEGFFLCVLPYDLDIDVANNGTENEIITVEIHYPEHARLNETFNQYLSHDTAQHILVIDLDTLHPFFSKHIVLPFKAPGSEHVGEISTTQIKVVAIRNQVPEVATSAQFFSHLYCSYDPNDKKVVTSNGTKDVQVNSDDQLTYTIRFQNTGNYPAEHVLLVDTLSAQVDMSTFTFLSSSHPVDIHQNGNILSFYFNHIQLPDSSADFTGSQGYVTFSIRPYHQIQLGAEITNDASIYFDYNDAVLTNEVNSVVVDLTNTLEISSKNRVAIFPNPAQNLIQVHSPDAVSLINSAYQLFAPDGRPVQSGVFLNGQINIQSLRPGLYVLKMKTSGGIVLIGKFLKL